MEIIVAIIVLSLFVINQKNKRQVSKIQLMDPSQIMFSAATLEANFPEFINNTTEPAFIMHEDDWRQKEFVSKDNEAKIDIELSKIKDIHDNFTHDGGTYKSYKKIAMRDSITKPVNINFDELLKQLSIDQKNLKNFAIRDGGTVKGGFTFEAYGCVFYGVQNDNIISVLGIDELSQSMPEVVAAFIKSNNLYFINWHTGSKN
jgi:hypothetical protein